jgi:hypothetical protein
MLDAVRDCDGEESLHEAVASNKDHVAQYNRSGRAYGIFRRNVYHSYRGEHRPWLGEDNNVIMQASLKMVNERHAIKPKSPLPENVDQAPICAESLWARVDHTEETGGMLASCRKHRMIVTVRNILVARAATPW